MPSSEASYSLQENAALKILLHAAKYPSAAINGLLLGTVAQSDSDASAVTIVDAVPLFHTFLSLSPMLETALVQVMRWPSLNHLLQNFVSAKLPAGRPKLSF